MLDVSSLMMRSTGSPFFTLMPSVWTPSTRSWIISPYTFLENLGAAVQERTKINRQSFSSRKATANDARLIRARELRGYGLDAQWNDDFHHALRGLLTEEKRGYYEDYGEINQLVKAYREGFVYSGEVSNPRRRRHGTTTRDLLPSVLSYSVKITTVGNMRVND